MKIMRRLIGINSTPISLFAMSHSSADLEPLAKTSDKLWPVYAAKSLTNTKEVCELAEVGFEYLTGEYNDGGKIFRKRK